MIVLDTIDSTNTYLKHLAADGAPGGTAVLARTQTAGRGRLGRSFYSPPDSGLYLSVLRRPMALPEPGLVTAAAAVAVARVLRGLGAPVGIKWVNDILAPDGRKLCGILCEAGRTEEDFVVIGIGLNITTEAFPPELANIAVSLSELVERPPKAASLAESILAELDAVLAADPAEMLDEYRRHSVVLGRTVTVKPLSGEPFRATVRAILPDATLLVGPPDRVLSSAEVSLTPM